MSTKSRESENLNINGEIFEFVKTQRAGRSAIYKSTNAYLRIGDPEKIKTDLNFHKQMEAANFPVAKVISEGKQDGRAYFIESSLGDRSFGKIFADDIEKMGSITQESFNQFLSVMEKFAYAQLRTRSNEGNYVEFADGIHIDELCAELPERASEIIAQFENVKKKLAPIPFVITHGDFNANNIYSTGVIDLEDSFRAPYGYDLVGAITHIDYFPDATDFEYFAKYRFSEDQKHQYFEVIDLISSKANLPPLSSFLLEFEFSKAVWLLIRMHNSPKLQKFRYDLFTERFLKRI